ncbi:hypothetical protein GTZ97_06445 [Aquabacterium fontiphilum]|uniref:hypothetical protein n=1 Tax=Aquabacterium fontiphilum TaxID=450365 RepID=UPI001377870D|nr:hypothetical protein [Aquabacterium fontiphilum]NBD20309.1 hypothetical protein [Aquabacterium fontiphilum]
MVQRSGIEAGDGGFQVNVQGQTTLQGGVIASTDQAVDEGRNSLNTQGLSLSDIDNRASYEAKAVSVSVGTSAGQNSAGIGQASDSAASTTTAGVSGLAGDQSVRTGDASQGLDRIFDREGVTQDVTAQAAVMAEFGKQASKAVGDYAGFKEPTFVEGTHKVVAERPYDRGAIWTPGEDGRLVQVIPPQPSAALMAFIQANTGATYSWPSPTPAPALPPNAPRDRLTNLPLDEQGRYSRTVVLDGKAYAPKYHACATAQCSVDGANLDMTDPQTQAYVKALDKKLLKDIGTGATLGSLVTPVGAGGTALAVLGWLASGGQVLQSDTPFESGRDEVLKALSEKGGENFFRHVLGHTPANAARAVALINLSGGWDAFVNRVKIDLLEIKPDDTKK